FARMREKFAILEDRMRTLDSQNSAMMRNIDSMKKTMEAWQKRSERRTNERMERILASIPALRQDVRRDTDRTNEAQERMEADIADLQDRISVLEQAFNAGAPTKESDDDK